MARGSSVRMTGLSAEIAGFIALPACRASQKMANSQPFSQYSLNPAS